MSRRRRSVGLAAGGLVAAGLVAAARVPYDRAGLDYAGLTSVRITARDGSPLRVTLGGAETRAEWRPLGSLSPRLVQATLAAEDRRFWHHPGIDPLAVARALWTDVRAGRIVAGGSTITQQLAGLVWPEPRTPAGKLREAVRAVRLEMEFSKRDLLEQYLNRLPYGPGMHGAAVASQRLLRRDVRVLGAAPAATLAALPRAPSWSLRPEAHERVRARRDAILAAMQRRGDLSEAERRAAQAQALDLEAAPPPFTAPHFADWVLQQRPAPLRRAALLETTLDPDLQADVEGIVTAQLPALRRHGVQHLAVVVMSVEAGEVLALVGSPSWHAAGSGQVNGALAPRQPGSALKPFLYAQAFAAGWSPADLLADVPFRHLDAAGGEESPRNYDGRWHGPVRAREALASSFNVPAVRLQQQLGTERVLLSLRRLGLETLAGPAEHYGLGLTLGVGEVTLLDLTNAYAALARGGTWRQPVCLRAARDARGRTLAVPSPAAHPALAATASFLVQDVLADDRARIAGFGPHSVLDLPFPVAVKTGTSTDYRNSWCLGFSRDHVVGVWAGNFDATPIRGQGGVHCAGPVFRSVVQRLQARGSRPWSAAAPPGWSRRPVCTLSGAAPGPACGATQLEWFAPGTWEARARCSFHVLEHGRVAIDWPPEYRDWARERHAGGPPRAVAASLPAAARGASAAFAGPRIAAPLDGSVYYLDPRLDAQAGLRFAAWAAEPGDAWWLDGRPVPPTAADGSVVWRPVRGAHRLELVRGGQRARVRFTVH